MILVYPMVIMDNGDVCYECIDEHTGENKGGAILSVTVNPKTYFKGMEICKADDIRVIKAQHLALGIDYEPDTDQSFEPDNTAPDEGDEFERPETD